MKNKVQLIVYASRFGTRGLQGLLSLLNSTFNTLFSLVHILPCYRYFDGVDTGFDPVDHMSIDTRLGGWEHIRNFQNYNIDVMMDMIVNHISAQSKEFKDFLNGNHSDLFLCLDSVFPKGALEKDLANLYRPRPGLPFSLYQDVKGKKHLVWTTFTSQQIDINVHSKKGKEYLHSILDMFEASKVKVIRMDAIGYAIKKAGTSCFMIDETFEFIHTLQEQAKKRNMEMLVEIHSHYKIQKAIAKYADYIYDFCLPPLILYALLKKDVQPLCKWIHEIPKNTISVLDTHDGIGIVDVGLYRDGDVTYDGLLDAIQIHDLVEEIHIQSCGESKKATGEAASNVDLYQVNCSFYSALGENDTLYILARLLQFFSPGIPQVYYMGLLAGKNDSDLLRKTNIGRNINRRYYTEEQIKEAVRQSVVKQLLGLIQFRNTHPAFNGTLHISCKRANMIALCWKEKGRVFAELTIDVHSYSFCIRSCDGIGPIKQINTLRELENI